MLENYHPHCCSNHPNPMNLFHVLSLFLDVYAFPLQFSPWPETKRTKKKERKEKREDMNGICYEDFNFTFHIDDSLCPLVYLLVSFFHQVTKLAVRVDFSFEHIPVMEHVSFSTSVKTMDVYLLMNHERMDRTVVWPVCVCHRAYDRASVYRHRRHRCYHFSICHRDYVVFLRHVTMDWAAVACYDVHCWQWLQS